MKPDLRAIEESIKADVAAAVNEAQDAAVKRHACHLVGRRVRYVFHERDTHEADGVVRGVSLDSETGVLAFSVKSRSRNSGHTVTREMGRYAILKWIDEEAP